MRWFILIYILFHSQALHTRADNAQLQSYLQQRQRFVKEELNRHQRESFINGARQEERPSINFGQSRVVTLGNFSEAHTFTLFGRNYLLSAHELFAIGNESNMYILTSIARFHERHNKIAFVKAMEFDGIAYMMLTFEDACRIYRLTEDGNLQSIQTISTTHPFTDAAFFINNATLYLLTASGSGDISRLTVYKWEHSHFDQIQQTYIDGDVQLSHFSESNHEIIVASSTIFEFSSERMRKIQILDDDAKSTQMLTFQAENATFLIIFREDTRGMLFRWTEHMFALVDQFHVDEDVGQVFLTHFDEIPLLATANNVRSGNDDALKTDFECILKENVTFFTSISDTIVHLRSLHFARNVRKVLNMNIVEFDGERVVSVMAFTDDDAQLRFIVIPITFQRIEIVRHPLADVDQVEQCLQELETLIKQREFEQQKQSHDVDEGTNHHEALIDEKIPTDEQILEQRIGQDFPDFQQHFNRIQEALHNMELQSEELRSQLDSLLNDDILVINDKITIQGSLNAGNLSARNAFLGKLNGITWSPENWLQLKQNQVISTPIFIDSVKIDQLEADNNELFKDMLVPSDDEPVVLLDGTMRIGGALSASNIFAPQINGIPMTSVYLVCDDPAAQITGNKSFNNVHVADLHTRALNGKNASMAINWFTGRPHFAPQVHIEDLIVETINGVDWRNFSDSVFRIGKHEQRIKGNLQMESLKALRMRAQTLRDIPVDNLFTTATEQEVVADLHIANMDVPNVFARTVNGLNFTSDVVATFTNSSTTLIATPVTMKAIHITGNLEVNGSLHQFYAQNAIVGSQIADLLQIYGSKVKINGDLHLAASVKLLDAAKLFINGNEFNQAHLNAFWRKSTNQVIPAHFEAQHGVVTPHLNVKMLNDIHISDYMRNNNGAKKRTTFHFENATILGDVVIDWDKLQHQPDLARLNSDAVKLNGTYVVRGAKHFTQKIGVENLKTDRINNVETKDFLAQDLNVSMADKFIHNLTVQSVNARSLTIESINNISLRELNERVVFVDDAPGGDLGNVNFVNVTVANLSTQSINNKLFDEYIVDIKKIDSLKVLNRLEIQGNASIANVTGVGFINNVNMLATIDKMSSYDADNPIKGRMEFTGKIHINELFVNDVNNISIPDFITRLFYRNWPQNITAHHRFKVINTPNLFTPKINNVKTRYLVDVNSRQPQLIHVESGLRLINSQLRQSLYANFSACDINKAITSIRNVPKRMWHSLYVDAITLEERTNPLVRLLTNAVHRRRKDNIISAPMHLRHIHADTVFARKRINAIDLQHIIDDALRHNATDQVVTGRKEFARITTDEVIADGRVDIQVINNLHLDQIQHSIISKETAAGTLIEGHKTFYAGVQAVQLRTKSLGDIVPEDMVTQNGQQPVAKVIFDDLTVAHRMHVESVNNLNFTSFLQDRLLLHAGHDQLTTANYYFDELQLNGKTIIPSINDVQLDDVVFDDHLQTIMAPKKFTQRVDISGDAIFEQINEFPLAAIFDQAIILQESANISENIRLMSPSEISGEIRAESINGIPFDQLNELIQSDNHHVRTEIIHDTLNGIKKLVADNTAALRELSLQYLYLERAEELQIGVEHAEGARVVYKKDNSVMLYVRTTKRGTACGLGALCVCPTQQTIKIQTSSSSWHVIDNKYEQRIFSFADASSGAVVDVITNTKSQSVACSADISQEYTSVNWYTFPMGDAHSFPEHIIGYVSDVQFFALDGHVYVIIAKLFDAVQNSTSAESMVLRLAKDSSRVEQIQKIRMPTLARIHVFHTAQGVHLVIGNVGGQLHQEGTLTTDIYAFNRDMKMFELIRSVPSTGCASIASVVLSLDSLIILAQVDNPLIVLHYNAFYKNYFILESFLHDTPASSISVFYTGDFGESDAYLTAVAEQGQFFVYSYHYLLGWKLESDGHLEGLNALTPLEINRKQYLFATSSKTPSLLLSIVKQGS